MPRLTILTAWLAAFSTIAVVRAADAPNELPQAGEVRKAISELEGKYNSRDAKGLAACWTENGEFVGPDGARDGRDAIEKVFAGTFAAHTDKRFTIRLLELRVVNDHLALVDAVPELKIPGTDSSFTRDSPATAQPLAQMVLIKQTGRWLIESSRETIDQVAPQTNHLKYVEWLVGDWMSEASKAGISLRMSCDWTANHAFLIRKFEVEDKGGLLRGGTEVIGWDARENRIRSWVFDIGGSFGENIWVRDGNRWLMKYSGTLADGSEVSATNMLTKVDDETMSLQSKDRIVNGEREVDVPETVVKRRAGAKPVADTRRSTILP